MTDLKRVNYNEQIKSVKELLTGRRITQAEEVLDKLAETFPDDIDVWLWLAYAAELRGFHQKQLACLEQIKLHSEQRPEIAVRIAFAHLALGELESAKTYALDVLNSAMAKPSDLRDVGKLFHAIGMYKLSATAYSSVLKTGERIEGDDYEHGMALTLAGEIVNAKNAYTRSIKEFPSSPRAYSGLSKVRKATKASNNIQAMQELTKKIRNPWQAINLYHGLAKELDDLGMYREAFTALMEGKKRFRRVSPHDPLTCVKNIDNIYNVYNKFADDIPAKTDSHQHSCGQSPIFVTGMPRSGTTILERVLTNHSDVKGIGERLQFSLALKEQSPSSYTTLLDGDVLNQHWRNINFSLLGERYLHATRYLHQGAQRFVDKLPLNILYAGAILKALPNAKVVCILRNPLDILIGNYRQVFEYGSGTYAYSLDLAACAQYIVAIRKLAYWFEKHFTRRFKIIYYEDLVVQPEQYTRELFDFCDLNWQSHCLSIQSNQSEIGSASAAQVKEPIHTRSIGHAKHYLPWLKEIDEFFKENGGDKL